MPMRKRAAQDDPVLFSFGLLSDVQSGDKDDGVGEGRVQRYRVAPSKLGFAIDHFLSLRSSRRLPFSPRSSGPACVLSLGDIIDGRDDEETSFADLQTVLAHFRKLPLAIPVRHVIGNHCLKYLPRERLLQQLQQPSSYFRSELAPSWALLVLDTTDLSTHGGWSHRSKNAKEAKAFLLAHAGEERIKSYNGGIGSEQLAWLEAQLARASADGERLIVASHHCLLRGACRETHRAWNGDEVASLLDAHAGTVVLALAGHDHLGGFALSPRGLPFVTLQALLEAPLHGNAFGVVRVHADRIAIDGCGTAVSDRTLPLQPLPAPPPKADAGRGAKAAVPALAALAAAPPPKRRHWLRGKAKM